MTIDLEKFISNVIAAQAKVQHLEMKVKTAKRSKVPKAVKNCITAEYGDSYLLDADYVIFFWGNLSKEKKDSLFNVVDKALGTDANKLVKSDFKLLPLDVDSGSSSGEDSPQPKDDGEEDRQTSGQDETTALDSNDGQQDAQDEGKALNEDDSSAKPDVRHLFLKVTLK